MAEYPSLPLWTDAYIADTRHLTLEEHGAYLLLLMIAWRSSDCALPDDDMRLARMCGIGLKKWCKLREIIAPFFQIEDGKWYQKRLLKERSRVDFFRARQVTAGLASARTKALKTKERPPTGVATERPTKRQPKSNQPYPYPDSESPPAKTSTVPRARAREEEEDFLNEEAIDIAERFLRLREELWPETSDPVMSARDLARQAADWLAAGMGVEKLIGTIEWKMGEAGAPPNSLDAYRMTFSNALKDGAHGAHSDVGFEITGDEFLDPGLERLQLAWRDAAGDPGKRAELVKALGTRQAELDTGGNEAA